MLTLCGDSMLGIDVSDVNVKFQSILVSPHGRFRGCGELDLSLSPMSCAGVTELKTCYYHPFITSSRRGRRANMLTRPNNSGSFQRQRCNNSLPRTPSTIFKLILSWLLTRAWRVPVTCDIFGEHVTCGKHSVGKMPRLGLSCFVILLVSPELHPLSFRGAYQLVYRPLVS